GGKPPFLTCSILELVRFYKPHQSPSENKASTNSQTSPDHDLQVHRSCASRDQRSPCGFVDDLAFSVPPSNRAVDQSESELHLRDSNYARSVAAGYYRDLQ